MLTASTGARFAAGALVAILLAAGSESTSGPGEADEDPGPRPDEIELVAGPLSEDGLQIILGTPDVAVGAHRVAFVIQSREALVRAPSATVASFFLPDGAEAERRETALAVFRPWPYGTRGTYTTRLKFDAAGEWRIDVVVPGANGATRSAQLTFDVAETTTAPDVGDAAVPSANRTLDDVDDIGELTTGSAHDPDLYRTTIADAIDSGMPTVVVMASPAFCINAVCGPQVEALTELKDRYAGQANFIHVDFYDNPHEIQGDLDRARISQTVLEWSLPSSEWSFVIDRDRRVTARFEAYATLEELAQELERALQATP